MRRIIITIFVTLVLTMGAHAQGEGGPLHFDPDRFEADLEQYITTRAGLTLQEASIFFPEYRKMMKEQRLIFNQLRRYRHVDLRDNNACQNAINMHDELDIQIKQLQQQYHKRFMTILPASKVLKIIRAEEKFHRMAFKKFAKKGER